MKFLKSLGGNVELFLEDYTLILASELDLMVVSSAVHNGGLKKARFLLNAQVPRGYDQVSLHKDPEQFLLEKMRKLKIPPEHTVGMITAADVRKFSIVTREVNGLKVSAIITAGCSHAETAGEPIEAYVSSAGTINTVILIHGHPTESCLLQVFITAVEAKAAGLRELDIRSRYSGDLATGTITDSLAIASTNAGATLRFGGPASKLGKIVGSCTREAVKSAIIKQGMLRPSRSVLERFAEKKLPINNVIVEMLKICPTKLNEKKVKLRIYDLFKKPFFALVMMMAAKMDEEIKMGLIPKELGDINELAKEFRESLLKIFGYPKPVLAPAVAEKMDFGSYPFLKNALLCFLEDVAQRES
ncbi:MAG: adenosylcobinamide amidohydrolase [Candidatus Bathyarchaeia archaeon]